MKLNSKGRNENVSRLFDEKSNDDGYSQRMASWYAEEGVSLIGPSGKKNDNKNSLEPTGDLFVGTSSFGSLKDVSKSRRQTSWPP